MARIETRTMQTRDTLMDTLRQRLRAMLAMDIPPPAQNAVHDMLALTEAFLAPAQDIVDRRTFDGLIRLAGPSVAPDLLSQLDRDLGAVEIGLSAALAEHDIKAIRQHTHVLIALAGSVGAVELHAMAVAVNSAAHLPQPTDLPPLGQKLLHSTAKLRGFVRGELTAMVPPSPFAQPKVRDTSPP